MERAMKAKSFKSTLKEEFQSIIRSIGKQQFEQSLTQQILQPNWTARDEMLLLFLLDRFGFDNWGEIRMYLRLNGVEKSGREIQRHYYLCYLPQHYRQRFLDPGNREGDSPNSTKASSKATPVKKGQNYSPIDTFFAKNFDVGKIGAPDLQFEWYYNRHRHEFVEEHEEQAETLLADLQFREDDSEQERRIKFNLIEEYNRRLDARKKVRDFAVEHRLLEKRYRSYLRRLSSKSESNAAEEFQALARLLSHDDFQELTQQVGLMQQVRAITVGLGRLFMSKEIEFDSFHRISRESFCKCFKGNKTRIQGKRQAGGLTLRKLKLLLRQTLGVDNSSLSKILRLIGLNKYPEINRITEGLSIQRLK